LRSSPYATKARLSRAPNKRRTSGARGPLKCSELMKRVFPPSIGTHSCQRQLRIPGLPRVREVPMQKRNRSLSMARITSCSSLRKRDFVIRQSRSNSAPTVNESFASVMRGVKLFQRGYDAKSVMHSHTRAGGASIMVSTRIGFTLFRLSCRESWICRSMRGSR